MNQVSSKPKVTIKLIGAGISPETVPAGALAEFIANLEQAIVEMAIAKGTISPEQSLDEANVSLVAIGTGSDALAFALSPPVVQSASDLSVAVATGVYEEIALPSHDALKDIYRQAIARNWAVEFVENPEIK